MTHPYLGSRCGEFLSCKEESICVSDPDPENFGTSGTEKYRSQNLGSQTLNFHIFVVETAFTYIIAVKLVDAQSTGVLK